MLSQLKDNEIKACTYKQTQPEHQPEHQNITSCYQPAAAATASRLG